MSHPLKENRPELKLSPQKYIPLSKKNSPTFRGCQPCGSGTAWGKLLSPRTDILPKGVQHDRDHCQPSAARSYKSQLSKERNVTQKQNQNKQHSVHLFRNHKTRVCLTHTRHTNKRYECIRHSIKTAQN